ncbi:glycosyltransferase involved in cell wall biosynthesis [Comamonas sp. 4034]
MLHRWLPGKDRETHQKNGQSPLRVLHVGKYYPPYRGGMESFLADLIEQQRACGIDARAVVHGDPLPDDPEWLIRVPVQVTLVFAPIALGFPFALWKAIQRFKPDVLHLHMPNNAAFWPLIIPSARRIPWVVHWHSDVLVSEWDTVLKACYQLYKPFETKLLQHSEAILATSPPYMAASAPLQRWLYKTVAIPLGLKPLDTETLQQAEEEDVSEWGDAQLRILSVGRLTYYKGFDTLISAVAGFAEVQLLIAGEGEQRKDLEALIERERSHHGCANVKLLGQVSEARKYALFNSCDIFALASRERTEAFGLVLIEAMQHGKPCIASDLDGSGMSWVVGQSGTGQCYAPDQVQAWREAIRQALEAKAQLAHRGQVAQRAADAQFTIAQCEARIREIYQSFSPIAAIPDIEKAASSQLLVAVLHDLRDIDLLVQWRNASPSQQLVCVDATSDPEASSRLQQASITTLALADLGWEDVLAVVQRLVSEQGYMALTILPAHRVLDQGGIAEDRKPNWWQRLLGGLGIQYHRLGRDPWVLRDAATSDWALAAHGVLGAWVWSFKK